MGIEQLWTTVHWRQLEQVPTGASGGRVDWWAWPRISAWPVVVITLLCVVMEKCLRVDARSTADWVWGKTQRNRTFRRKWRVSKGLKQ